jgi:hypothetical protein
MVAFEQLEKSLFYGADVAMLLRSVYGMLATQLYLQNVM